MQVTAPFILCAHKCVHLHCSKQDKYSYLDNTYGAALCTYPSSEHASQPTSYVTRVVNEAQVGYSWAHVCIYSYAALTCPRTYHMHTIWLDLMMQVSMQLAISTELAPLELELDWLLKLCYAMQQYEEQRQKRIRLCQSFKAPTMHRLRSSTASTIVATDLAQSAPHWMKGWVSHVTTSKWAANWADRVTCTDERSSTRSIDALPRMHTKFSRRNKHVVQCYNYSKYAAYCILSRYACSYVRRHMYLQ